MPEEPRSELFFATVRAIGTPLAPSAVDPLEAGLNAVNYGLKQIRLSEKLKTLELTAEICNPPLEGEQRYHHLFEAGKKLRDKVGVDDAVLTEALKTLHIDARTEARDEANITGRRGVGYLFRSLMHPDEVDRLRKIYGRRLFVISVHSQYEDRLANLNQDFNPRGRREGGDDDVAKTLIKREADRIDPARSASGSYQYEASGVDIPATFQHGDLFLDANDPKSPHQTRRFIELVFGHPFHTPTKDEIGMADAFNAALQSGNLARQVGAAICSEEGNLLSTGTNDVPRPGGGVYMADSRRDSRDYQTNRFKGHVWGYDSSDVTRRTILSDLIKRLIIDVRWLERLMEGQNDDQIEAKSKEDFIKLIAMIDPETLDEKKGLLDEIVNLMVRSPSISKADFFGSIEYGRTLHAEMDAITSAARKGVSTQGATLYCTTYPCHECARLIIGSGIKRVIFIEPYDKSRVRQLYASEVRFTSLATSRKKSKKKFVDFVPYVGISPRRFSELFSAVDRKADDVIKRGERDLLGIAISWDPKKSIVRPSIITESAMISEGRFNQVIEHEQTVISEYQEKYNNALKTDRKKRKKAASKDKKSQGSDRKER